MFLLLSRFTKRLLENIEDFFPSPISFWTTSIFFLSWLFFKALIFFSNASRFSLIDLCSNIFSSFSATISSASFEVSSGRLRGSVADLLVDSTVIGNWMFELPLPPLAAALSEVFWSVDDNSTFVWWLFPMLVRCFGLLDAVSDGLISFLSVPTVPKPKSIKNSFKGQSIYSECWRIEVSFFLKGDKREMKL